MQYKYGLYYKGNLIKICNTKEELKENWFIYTKTEFKETYYARRRKNFKFNVNGYSFKSYKNNNIEKKIPFEKSYQFTNENKKTKINNIIYAFDIETSTYDVDSRKLSLVYLAGGKGIDFKPDEINTDNYNNYTTEYYKMRSYDDISKWFEMLNNDAERNNYITLIYIHNFSYEFSFFQNIKFITDNFNNDNLMALKTRQPFKLRVKNIEFRCSFKLSLMSLKSIGENIGLEKLDNIKDYDVKLSPISHIDVNEWIYNERDCDVTLLAVINEFKKCSNLNNSTDKLRNLFTATGLTRYENKQLSDIKIQKNYSAFCRGETKLYDTLLTNGIKFYQLLMRAFLGGYVRANRFELFKVFEKVGSIDIASSYPTQMKNRLYPYNYKICDKNMLNKLLDMININNEYISKKSFSNSNLFINNNSIENWFFSSRGHSFIWYFICDIELVNLKIKTFSNNNEIPLISFHKILYNKGNKNDSTFITDNGRVLQGKYIRLTVTNVDLFLISLFYDFEIKNCKALIYTDETQKLNKYVLNSIDFYAEQKVIFKDLLKKSKNDIFPSKKDFFSDKLNQYIIDENIINQFLIFDDKTKLNFLSKQLALAKSRLNAQYGINVQSPLPPKIKYDIITNEWYSEEQNFLTPTTLLRNYSDGVFIVAYARLHLLIMSYMIIKYTNSTILYWDTDSIKFVNDNNKVLNIVDYFNKCITSCWAVNKKFNFGIFDDEGTYDYFVTGGSKSYMALKNNKIILTVSGVPKKTGEYYTQLLNEKCGGNFYELVNKYYHPNTIITSEITGKLSMGYYTGDNNKFDCEVIDEQNKKYHFIGYGGTVLCDSNFTIYGIKNLLDIIKYNEMCKITHNKIPHNITVLGKINEIDNKLKSEWELNNDIL